jgi:hypothetical protein
LSNNDNKYRTPAKFTARELLVEVAGVDHAQHTVVAWREPESMRPPRGALHMRCSCGALCSTLATDENIAALQNVALILKKEVA